MLNNYKFKSAFRDELNYFIKYKRSLGNDYKNEINSLKHLDIDLCSIKLISKK